MAEFLHPSTSSKIIDNTVTFVTAQGLTVLYAAFPAQYGPDNRMQQITSDSEFLYYYGAPNIRKYGQTSYNVYRWLQAGGSAIGCRILPYMDEDSNGNAIQPSTYAVFVLEIGVKVSGDKKLKIRTRTLGDGRGAVSADVEKRIRDDASLQSIVLAAPENAEADGFKYYPITLLRGRDRGEHYNAYGPRFELETALDETYSHRLYNLSIYRSSSAVAESFVVSLYPEAQDLSGRSQFIVNVLNNYSTTTRALFNEDNYDEVCAYISSNPVDYKKLDLLELKERTVSVPEALHAGVSFEDGSADLSPSPAMYRPMGGGTDGDWVGPNSVESLLYKAYSASGDFVDPVTGANKYDTYFSDIANKKAYPIDMMLDANYPTSVKVAMSSFAARRGDFMTFLDCGFTGSPGQALKYRQEQLTLNTFHTAIWAQDMVVYDEFTGSDIRVTPTYFLAAKVPEVDLNNGIQWPFVGPRRGSIAGLKSISWTPNDAYQEQLYLNKLNYVQKDTRTTRFNSQVTSQFANSALSDINNVRTLLRIRRDVEAAGENFQFEFNDANSWGALETDLNSYGQKWVSNRALTSFKATVYASEYDRQQRILRVKIELVFNGVIERVFTDIVVNR